MAERYEAVIVGTGFGGAISACRLSKKWPGKVLVLERGKRYPLGSYPRSPRAVANNFWNTSLERRPRPDALCKVEQRGLFDIRLYDKMDVLLGAGLGGGSLIYANVFLEPPGSIFDSRWPKTCDKENLQPSYRIAKEVLGSRPIPQTGEASRQLARTELFQKVAKRVGRDSELLDINVFFGNDFNKPLPQGQQDRNRYGALQTSCLYCAECDIGCNYQAKNTLDLNYLYQAETCYQAAIRTEHLVDRIAPLNDREEDDPAADGSHGYRVHYRDLASGAIKHEALAKRVVLSAGALGSTELLLRCRDIFHTLPRLNGNLGKFFSGNGDFLSFVIRTREPADPNRGPVITQRIDFNLFADFARDHAFIMEDASYPALLAWFVEGAKPGFLKLNSLWRSLRDLLKRPLGGSPGPIGHAFHDLLNDDISYNTAVLLCMGLDRSNGVMTLDRNGWLDLTWPGQDSRPLYDAILDAGKRFKHETRAEIFAALPTWSWPARKNITVHPLGGCILSDGPSGGVTSADRRNFGQVHEYSNLYVADGGVLPTAVGANPTATIAALAEMVAEGITQIPPTADL